eukprot:5071658-Pyramimonas_sp.AAC.1
MSLSCRMRLMGSHPNTFGKSCPFWNIAPQNPRNPPWAMQDIVLCSSYKGSPLLMAGHPAPFLTYLADLRGPRPMEEGAARAPEVWLRSASKQQRREQ